MSRRKVNNDAYYQNIYDDYMANLITVSEIAKKYNISVTTVYNVKANIEKKQLNNTYTPQIQLPKTQPVLPQNNYDNIIKQDDTEPYYKNTSRPTRHHNQIKQDDTESYYKNTGKPTRHNNQIKQDEVTELCERSWELYNVKYSPIEQKPKTAQVDKKPQADNKQPKINIQTKKIPEKKIVNDTVKNEKRKRIGQDALAFLESYKKRAEECDSQE